MNAAKTQPLKAGLTKRQWRSVKQFIQGVLFLSPSLILFMVFVFIPLVKSIVLSGYITTPIGAPAKFVGLQNYSRFLADPAFLNSIKTTFLFILYVVPPTILISLILALLGNMQVNYIQVFRVLFSFTIAVSAATASLIFLYIYHPTVGVNYLLSLIGIPKIEWLVSSQTALFSIALITVWLQVGLNMVILLAAIQAIPEELFESAMIDGADWWKQLIHITLPLLSSTFFFLLVVDTLAAFQTFTPIHILTKGGPLSSTNLIVYSVYREFYFNGKYGLAAAQSIVLFVIMLVLTIIQFVFIERKVFYE